MLWTSLVSSIGACIDVRWCMLHETVEQLGWCASIRIMVQVGLVSRSQTVCGGKTVWTTDVERFVLTPTGTGVGDKWVLSVCGARATRTSIALSQHPRPRGH